MMRTARLSTVSGGVCLLGVALPKGGWSTCRGGLPVPWNCGKADLPREEIDACEYITFSQLRLQEFRICIFRIFKLKYF